MPLYDWACRNGHKFEVKASIAERDEPVDCPECGDEDTRRVFLGAPIIPWAPWTTRSPYKERRRNH